MQSLQNQQPFNAYIAAIFQTIETIDRWQQLNLKDNRDLL